MAQAFKYLFQVNSKNTRLMCWMLSSMCLKLLFLLLFTILWHWPLSLALAFFHFLIFLGGIEKNGIKWIKDNVEIIAIQFDVFSFLIVNTMSKTFST